MNYKEQIDQATGPQELFDLAHEINEKLEQAEVATVYVVVSDTGVCGGHGDYGAEPVLETTKFVYVNREEAEELAEKLYGRVLPLGVKYD